MDVTFLETEMFFTSELSNNALHGETRSTLEGATWFNIPQTPDTDLTSDRIQPDTNLTPDVETFDRT